MPVRSQRLFLALLGAAALWLRVHDLGVRPMHADEANQAVKFGELLESGRYAFDPRDHHGPTLYYAALPIAWARGERTLSSLTETTVRLVPALAGVASVLLIAALAAPFGPWPALAAAAFVAFSPPAVYYSRYFVQESLLAAFTLGLLVCGQRWWRFGGATWAISAGVCAGLMQATKASAPLFGIAALAALVLTRARPRASGHLGREAALAGGAALAVAALFYASFGTHPSGLRDSVSAYGPSWARAWGKTGHEKPWWYYLGLFGWRRVGGLVWQQAAFSALALAGFFAALRSPDKFPRWTAIYALLVAAALALVPYKTPWHAVHLVTGLGLLAAFSLSKISSVPLAVALFLAVLTQQAIQTWRVAFTYPADERNPYAYVHSSPDVLKFRPLVEAALRRAPNQPVRVIGEEYWPLPWYLRGLPRIGYWSEPPEACDGALVIVTASYAAQVRSRLRATYRESYLGLRPGVLCLVFTPAP